jgi:hypothetical protein
MADDDGKITSLVDRLRAKAAEERVLAAHMDRIHAALPIIKDAVYKLRREVPDITIAEIAGTFEIAAEQLRASEGWPGPPKAG